ncbi:MAG: F0F1 ATP synthase subunit alpha, partial [Bacteroidales bacterium]|nr:F0F1 ATP synthase subunit alpha [Bacteroidales bacterium]
GTLKLDQAQYRELEAFSKFSSDLDASTKFVIEKGKRNVEILKQKQYAPMKVEHQIAIICCGVKGWLLNVPIHKIHDFETDYLFTLENNHKEVLERLRQGILDDEIIEKLKKIALDKAAKYIV